ncbi:sulfur reduction protein DsrE [Aestuariibaculum suncheonense]|nr:sulfur reduction protein DsrE [Aestuariibaculum suncheonense]
MLVFGSLKLQAQAFNPKNNNYLILSKNIEQLKPAILTAEALIEEDGKSYGDFYVVICGKTVSDIPNNNAFNNLLLEATSKQVKVFVCGLSMKKFNVNPKDLPEHVNVVDNGILFGFQLKKQGFISLTI